MYAVGRLGSYISRGVHTVSGPFHPFGGAVDIVVVEQPDGSFKSSPWYVRFGKFQGVLKTRENIVSIRVNGIEANFHMFLDHKGEAYFLRTVDGEEGESEGVSFPFPSGYDTDEAVSGSRMPMKSKSCNYDADRSSSAGEIDLSNGKILSRTTSRRSRIFGLVFGRRSMKENCYQEVVDGADVMRLDSLDRAEIAADLLEVKWSTNLASNRSNINTSRLSCTNDSSDNKASGEHTCEENQTLLNETECSNEQKVSSHSGIENVKYSVEEASIQVSNVSTEQQIVVTSSLDNGFMEDKCEVIANVSGSIVDRSVVNSGHNGNETGSVSDMSGPDLQSRHNLETSTDKQFDEELLSNGRNVVLPFCKNSNEEVVPNSPRSFVYSKTSESSVITSNGSSEQTHQTLSLCDVGNGKIHVHAETMVTTTISELGDQPEDEYTNGVVHCSLESVDDSQNFYHERDPERSVPPSESSEDEQFLFSDLDEFKLREQDSVNNSLCNVNNDSYLNPDNFVQENLPNDMELSIETSRIISKPISISRNHRVAGENNGLQVESLPNMWSPDAKFDANNYRLVSRSLDLNAGTMKLASIRKDNSSSKTLEADEERPLEPERSSSAESGTSGKLKKTLHNPAVEISLCKHLLFEGMGAEAACQVFDAEKLDSKKFSSLGPAVLKNDKLVVRTGGRYFPWDDAAPIILGMVTFGSEELFEPKGMIPVEKVEKSFEGDPSKEIFSHSGSWRLWPFSLKRSRSRKTVQLVPSDTRGLDAENTANVTVASEVKKMIRAITPTSEHLASLNLKDGINHITFTFSTPMLGNQQVDARIYLWKWNTRVVISDVDGTITKSDVLGQFMPLVGIDWSQTGVAHLFSAIKENGYQLLFLSARAISQAYITRQFLVNLKQDGKALPDGPIVISPDGLFPSLYREVIRRAPHEFKIACLEEIKALFPSDCNPFYAGFGNRDTDEISYVKVGIPKGKIFIINPKGEVAVNRRVDTKSYSSLHALVHGMFPSTTSSEQEDFNSWNFWKLPPPLMDI